MREILTLHVGQCGNNIGSEFWKKIVQEHGLDFQGNFNAEEPVIKLERINVYFEETHQTKYVPRSVFVDLDPQSVDTIKGGILKHLFHPDALIHGSKSSGNNWIRGHYNEGPEICDSIMDVIRKKIEICDCLQGFQITHSLGGGTGSGLGTLLATKIREEYQDRIIQSFSVFPSSKVSDCVIEPYNSILCMNTLTEVVDNVLAINNESLYNICSNNLKIDFPTYGIINSIVGTAMSGITSSFRFLSESVTDLRKMSVNLTPFPRLHYFTIAEAPLQDRISKCFVDPNELIHQMFSSSCSLGENLKLGKYYACTAIFRGHISILEVDDLLTRMKSKYKSSFSGFIPNSFKTTVCDVPSTFVKMSSTLVANNSAVQILFKRLSKSFKLMHRRQAFLHWYTGEGIDRLEFTENEMNTDDLVTEYSDGEWDAIVDSEEAEEMYEQES